MVTSHSVTVPTRSLLSSDVEGLVVVPDVTVMCASVDDRPVVRAIKAIGE